MSALQTRARYWMHLIVDVADRSVPGWLRARLKRVLPELPRHVNRWLALKTSDQPTTVTIRSGPLQGRQWVCSLKQGRSYFLGTHESARLPAFERLIRPGGTVLDLGGHQGYVAATFAAIA